MNDRYALISDIHSNLVALEAVLRDIKSVGVKEIWCLGDIVGYGAQPVECYRRVMDSCAITIMGNHEQALSTPEKLAKFNGKAKGAIEWTRQCIQKQPDGAEIMTHLATLPTHFTKWEIMFAHGSPAEPTNEYLLPKVCNSPTRMARNFAIIDHYCFVGHTHQPGVIEEGDLFTPPDKMIGGTGAYMLDYSYKAVINVGSVGQPRDRNPKSCYVLFDGDSVQYRRVGYDVQEARKRIYQVPILDNFLGDRLVVAR